MKAKIKQLILEGKTNEEILQILSYEGPTQKKEEKENKGADQKKEEKTEPKVEAKEYTDEEIKNMSDDQLREAYHNTFRMPIHEKIAKELLNRGIAAKRTEVKGAEEKPVTAKELLKLAKNEVELKAEFDGAWDGIEYENVKVVTINMGNGFEDAFAAGTGGGYMVYLPPYTLEQAPTAKEILMFHCNGTNKNGAMFIKGL